MGLRQSTRLFFLFVVTALVAACGSSGDKEKNSKEFKDAEEGLNQNIEGLVGNLPAPSEVPYMIQATGAEYNGSLLSPRGRSDQFTARSDKAAINLGVYVADIGYLVMYDKTQEAIDYLDACKDLADNLGVIGSFDLELLQKFETNISNKDSLARLIDNTTKKTESLLQSEERSKLAALVLTGSFIEGLSISTGLVTSYPKDLLPDDARNLVLTPLIRIILEQKKEVSDLVSMLSSVDQSGVVGELMGDLKQLDTVYQNLNIEEQIRNNRADLVLSDKNLQEIAAVVARLRKTIVS